MRHDLALSVRATWRLLVNKRFWFGPDRLGHLVEVLEWGDAEQTKRGR